ncbi:Uu.00g108800.m01.CDS01 [Anthostomella pinea]|uniref:Uu.00g108800.m01.CDS01 n=1 Tax=Anthostomella pinea TaxID=933095 RepID=A0AAI8VEH2_9PEZI|nr:Uu.00g108800.m01.CDS01 [Anthostomella pinea]
MAKKWHLTRKEIEDGTGREVILFGWGNEAHHPAIKNTSFYQNGDALEHWDLSMHHVFKARFSGRKPSFLTSMAALGLPYKINNYSIANNAGNHSAFAMHLLLALSYMTDKQSETLHRRENLPPLDV